MFLKYLSKILTARLCVYPIPQDPRCVNDGITDEIIVGLFIVLLVVYTFLRFCYVWVNTLNFSEVRISLNCRKKKKIQNKATNKHYLG